MKSPSPTPATPATPAITPAPAGQFAAPTAQRNPGLLGVGFFIITESIFFLGLFLAYFYMRAAADVWPPVKIDSLTSSLAIVNTIVSLVSAGLIAYAAHAIKRDNRRGLLIGIIGAAALGIVFMGIQSAEFAQLGSTAQASSYGSMFVGLLVLHVARVFAGVALMLIVLVRTLLGQFSSRRNLLVQAAAMYWYFIVGIWMLVFYVLYILV